MLDSETNEEVMNFIINRNSPLPTSRIELYCASRNGQTRSLFKFYQGESRYPDRNLFLGELEVPHPAAVHGQPTFSARMTYDINGILAIDVDILANGNHYSKVILSKGSTMSEADVKTALAKMEKLKISPAEKEENRLLIARAERIFEEALPEERILINEYLSQFRAALKTQNNRLIRNTAEELESALGRMEY